MFIGLVTCLWKKGITPIFVFDGKHKLNKSEEMKKRKERYTNNENEVLELEKAILEYLENGTIHPILEKHSKLISKRAPKTFLISKKPTLNIDDLQYKLETMKKSLIRVTADTLNDLKELFTLMQVQWIVAHNEGEFACYKLFEQKKVSAVMSGDTDLLALGCNLVITNVNTSTCDCESICMKPVLETLEMNQTQFLDLCIMLGTDFNTNLPGIGPVNSFKMIKDYKTVEEIKNKFDNLDFTKLNYDNTKSIFLDQKENEQVISSFNVSLKYQDFKREEISTFLFKKNLDQGFLRIIENAFGVLS